LTEEERTLENLLEQFKPERSRADHVIMKSITGFDEAMVHSNFGINPD